MQLREYMLDSTFEPAQKGGQSVSSNTHLTIRYRLIVESDTKASLEILSADNGPIAAKRFGLRYPATGIAGRIQSLVLVQATVEPDGRVSDVNAAMQWPKSSLLSRTAVRAVRKWRFVPDKVDGVAITSDVLIPIQFCIERCSVDLPPDRIRQLISDDQPPSKTGRQSTRSLPLLPLVQVVASRIGSGSDNFQKGTGEGRFRRSR